MWFFRSLWHVELMLAACTLTGFGVVQRCLPGRLKPAAGVFLSPLLGLAVLVLAATATGWLTTGGYRTWWCAGATGLLAAWGAWTIRRERQAFRSVAAVLGFGLPGSLSTLFVVFRWSAFNPYNDSIYYLTHMQWLQAHGFRESVVDPGLHPVLPFVTFFQEGGLRMGADFFLAWMQAAFGCRWAEEIYPAGVALATICGALTLGAVILAVCPRRRPEAWLASLVAAGTVNGFTTSLLTGFVPQTFGVAFLAGACALRAQEMALQRPGTGGGWRPALPLALCLAGGVFCYAEITPFVGLGMALSYLAGSPRGWRPRAIQAARVLILTLALTNGEWFRVIRAIRGQLSGQPGWPVDWPWWAYAAHAIGWRSGIGDLQYPIYHLTWKDSWQGLVPTLLFLVCLWPLLRRRVSPLRLRWSGIWPLAVMGSLFGGAFILFRYHSASPWPDPPGDAVHYVGNSYRQFKLAGWSSLTMLALVLPAVVAFGGGRGRVPRVVVLILLALWCGAGLDSNYHLSRWRVTWLQTLTDDEQHPFAGYAAMRTALAHVPASDLVYLDFPTPGAFKHRQFLAYCLMDHCLVSDWQEDQYILAFRTPASTQPTREQCQWIIRYDPAAAGLPHPPGCLTLHRQVPAEIP